MDEIITNEAGGKQSRIEGQITEVPPLALIEISKVMSEGRKKYPREPDGTPNWHKIGCMSNLDHAGEHLCKFLAIRNQTVIPMLDEDAAMQEELSHFAARALMALEQFLRNEL